MTTEEQIKKMYEGQLNSQKEQLATDYQNAISNLDTQKETAQKKTDENLNRTAVEAQKAAVSNEEYYNASGLSSGAKAQARLSQENQALANMTAIRTAQQEADAQIERSRGLLAKEYESAIRKAQADNDLELAKALYEEAQRQEEKLRAEQEAAASIMAQGGDYSRYGELYGLTADEIAKLNKTYASAKATSSIPSKYQGAVRNGSVSESDIIAMQNLLGVTPDGKWGAASRQAADERWGVTDPDLAWEEASAILNPQTEGIAETTQLGTTPKEKVTWTDQWGSISVNANAQPVLEALKLLQTNGSSQYERRQMLTEAYNEGVLTKNEYLALMQRA